MGDVIGKMRHAVPSMGRVLKEGLWGFLLSWFLIWGESLIKSNKFRKINIDGDVYGWMIKGIRGYSILHVEPFYEDGSRLEVYVESDLWNFWIDFPKCKDYNLRVITPKEIRFIILKAISKGWNPKNKSDSRLFYLINEDLIVK